MNQEKEGDWMSHAPIYAVVDIETTGTDTYEDRMIQFGCVLVENGKIVSTFATDINPGIRIPAHIEQLTGIKNSRAKKAPYLEDVAYTIHQLLAGCIFVAHNINFDYHFLSKELERCGLPKLSLPGIDTVELAQIFFPTSPSFRLQDLADQFDFTHTNPHQADSDAHVTAELLIKIEKKIQTLPLVTLEKLGELAEPLSMNTGSFIQEMVSVIKEEVPLPLSEKLQVVSGIALRKKEPKLFLTKLYEELDYPKSKKEKEKLFLNKMTYRSGQAKMMNAVYKHFQTESEEKNLAIEASTGSGKTFGYLLPISYFARPENPVVISTVSILLENQLLNEAIPKINQVVPKKIQPVLLKSYSHYLDLERFHKTLQQPQKQKMFCLFQMKLLVWLLETDSGDLDELNLTKRQHPFWQEVTHKGISHLEGNSAFYEEDFYLFLKRKLTQSNVIIVNHAFLCQENFRKEFELPQTDYLIIDEAHHLPRIMQESGTDKVYEKQFSRWVNDTLAVQSDPKLMHMLLSEKQEYTEITLINQVLEELEECYEEFTSLLQTELVHTYGDLAIDKERPISASWFSQTSLVFQKCCKEFINTLCDGERLVENFSEQIEKNWGKYTVEEHYILEILLEKLSKVASYYQFFKKFLTDWRLSLVKWIIIEPKKRNATFYTSDLASVSLNNTLWYTRYKKVLYTSGTLTIGKSSNYLARSLGLERLPIKKIPEMFDYQEQARVYVPTDAVNRLGNPDHAYAHYLADCLRKLIEYEKRPLLALFTSHEVLQEVYRLIHRTLEEQGWEILAQGISGTNEKLLKRFKLSEKAILLGADSFWDGIDLPSSTVQILVMTRLPFDAPNRPFVKAKYHYLETLGKSSFYNEALPKATMRLRQGLGRLIRTPQDKGVLLILDQRIMQKKYGQKMLKAFPESLPVIDSPLETILSEIHSFLDL